MSGVLHVEIDGHPACRADGDLAPRPELATCGHNLCKDLRDRAKREIATEAARAVKRDPSLAGAYAERAYEVLDQSFCPGGEHHSQGVTRWFCGPCVRAALADAFRAGRRSV